MSVVAMSDVEKRFGAGENSILALDGVNLVVEPGEFCVVTGRSGSGKTTLLNIVGGLEAPDSGDIEVAGCRLWEGDDEVRAELRRTKVAFIFQAFGLLPQLSAFENVEVPLRLQKMGTSDRRERVTPLLERVGLGPRAKHRPGELSGGEQQRVAIARALAAQPQLIIADEPTGQLDSTTAEQILRLMREVSWDLGTALLVATHDPAITASADHVWKMNDGRLSRS